MNKGFTLVELIVTFTLASLLIIILINVLILIKANYEEVNTRTKIYLEQAKMSNTINSLLSPNNIASIEDCSRTEDDFCIRFELNEEPYEFYIGYRNDEIDAWNTYGSSKLIKYGKPTLTYDGPYMIINIPISSPLYPNENFDINIVEDISYLD